VGRAFKSPTIGLTTIAHEVSCRVSSLLELLVLLKRAPEGRHEAEAIINDELRARRRARERWARTRPRDGNRDRKSNGHRQRGRHSWWRHSRHGRHGRHSKVRAARAALDAHAVVFVVRVAIPAII
jgi:hypothetical protein